MGAIILLMLLLFALGVIYPVAAIAYLKLIRRSPKSLRAILAEI